MEILTGIINAVLFPFIWGIFIQGPLQILNVMQGVIQQFSGSLALQLIFGVNSDLKWDGTLPIGFTIFISIGGALAIFMIIANIVGAMLTFKNGENVKRAISTALSNSVMAIFIIMLIPFGFFLLGLFLNGISSVFPNIFGIADNANIGDYVYWIGNTNGSMPNPVVNMYPYNIPGDFLTNWNIFIELFGVIFILIILFLFCLQIVIKVFEIVVLFFTAPIIGATITVDDGKRMRIWRDMVIGKFVINTLFVFAFYLFIFVLNLFMTNIYPTLNKNGIEAGLITLFFIAGTSVGMTSVGMLISAFLGEGATLREGLSGLANTMKVGMGLAGAGAVTFKTAWKVGGLARKATLGNKLSPTNFVKNKIENSSFLGGVKEHGFIKMFGQAGRDKRQAWRDQKLEEFAVKQKAVSEGNINIFANYQELQKMKTEMNNKSDLSKTFQKQNKKYRANSAKHFFKKTQNQKMDFSNSNKFIEDNKNRLREKGDKE